MGTATHQTRARITPRGRTPSRRLVGCCLLDGGVRASPLVEQSGRSVLDLDVGRDCRLLDAWMRALGPLPWDTETPLLRILHGGPTPAPSASPFGPLRLEIRQDADSYRGPAGVVRDGMSDQSENSEFLVCEAGWFVTSGLEGLVEHHRRERADVTIGRTTEGKPGGVLIVARAMLDEVADRGFVDLKEQWLRRLLSQDATVLVHDLPPGAAMSIRTRLDLLQAARKAAGATDLAAAEREAPCQAGARLSRRLQPGWAISGYAHVGARAIVARSIVMERAVIGDDAVVSSSIVLPGAVVAPGSVVMDRVVA